MEWVKKREKGAERGRVKLPRTENGKRKIKGKFRKEEKGKRENKEEIARTFNLEDD